MLEDLFNNLLVLYESDDTHLALTFGASKKPCRTLMQTQLYWRRIWL